MSARTGLLVCVLGAAWLGGPAMAYGQKAIMAPLGALGVDAATTRRVETLLARAGRHVDGYTWMSSARLARRLAHPKYFGCADDPACIGKLARRSGAQVVVTGDVGSIGGANVVYLRLITADGQRMRVVNGVIDLRKRDNRQVAEALMVQLLAPSQYTGTLVIRSDVADAWIYLDGQRMARGKVARLSQVPVGTHAVRVTHEAHADFVQFVTVGFQQSAEVNATLAAFAVQAEEMRLRGKKSGETLKDSELPWYRRWWAVAAFGAVVLAASATTAALIPRPIERDREATVMPPGS